MPVTHLDIERLQEDLRQAEEAYLRRNGWTVTCNTPGSYWLWRRDFTPEHQAAHARWKERGPGPMGWPSEPKTYGVITVDRSLAVSMTRATLDEDKEEMVEG